MKVEVCSRQAAVECPPEEIRRVLRIALRQEEADAQLSVALLSGEEIAELNRRFLDREGETDVLAFPYEEADGRVAGEIVVNAQLAARRAAEKSHGPRDELMLYIVHGLLHLLGYGDHGPEERRRMRRREQEALEAAGYRVDI